MAKREPGYITPDEIRRFAEAFPHWEKQQDTLARRIGTYGACTRTGIINVLQAGSGTGLLTKKILAADPRIVMEVVEPDGAMIQEMWQYLGVEESLVVQPHQERIQDFLQCFPDEFYDIFASAHMLHGESQNERNNVILPGAFRVLKPGGLFLNADFYEPDNPQEFLRALTNFHEGLYRATESNVEAHGRWVRHVAEELQPSHIQSENGSIATMAAIGFKDIEVYDRIDRDAVLMARKPQVYGKSE